MDLSKIVLNKADLQKAMSDYTSQNLKLYELVIDGQELGYVALKQEIFNSSTIPSEVITKSKIEPITSPKPEVIKPKKKPTVTTEAEAEIVKAKIKQNQQEILDILKKNISIPTKIMDDTQMPESVKKAKKETEGATGPGSTGLLEVISSVMNITAKNSINLKTPVFSMEGTNAGSTNGKSAIVLTITGKLLTFQNGILISATPGLAG